MRKYYNNEVYESASSGKNPPIWAAYAINVFAEEDLKEKSILDVGAGFGEIIDNLKNKGAITYAIEISDRCIRHLEHQNIDVRKIDISSEELPFSDSFFDYVIFTEVVEHLVFPQHILNEINRVLKPSGKLIISTHNSFNLYMRFVYVIGKIPTPDLDVTKTGQHIRLYSYDVLLELLKRAGFRRTINRSWFKFAKISFNVPNFLTPLCANHFLLICEK